MSWETIEALGPPKAAAVPPRGIRVTVRAGRPPTRSGGFGARTRFIMIAVGEELAKAVAFHLDVQPVRLMFGAGGDAGKIAVSADMAGKFRAKRARAGFYNITINQRTADGLFSLDFPAFAEDRCEAIRPENGQPPKFIFKASAEMLAVED